MNISDKELQIITLKAKGKTVRDISKEIFISKQSVHKIVNRLLFRLGLKNSNQLIDWAWENEILKKNRENLPVNKEG